MNATIKEKLIERIPENWGKWIGCDDGWNWILEDLDRKLSYLDPNYELNQLKEKFGTLRFYYQPSVRNDIKLDLMDDAVTIAEMLSASTCELCGNSSRVYISDKGVKYDSTVGLKVRGGWYKTLCDGCAEGSGYLSVEDGDEDA